MTNLEKYGIIEVQFGEKLLALEGRLTYGSKPGFLDRVANFTFGSGKWNYGRKIYLDREPISRRDEKYRDLCLGAYEKFDRDYNGEGRRKHIANVSRRYGELMRQYEESGNINSEKVFFDASLLLANLEREQRKMVVGDSSKTSKIGNSQKVSQTVSQSLGVKTTQIPLQGYLDPVAVDNVQQKKSETKVSLWQRIFGDGSDSKRIPAVDSQSEEEVKEGTSLVSNVGGALDYLSQLGGGVPYTALVVLASRVTRMPRIAGAAAMASTFTSASAEKLDENKNLTIVCGPKINCDMVKQSLAKDNLPFRLLQASHNQTVEGNYTDVERVIVHAHGKYGEIWYPKDGEDLSLSSYFEPDRFLSQFFPNAKIAHFYACYLGDNLPMARDYSYSFLKSGQIIFLHSDHKMGLDTMNNEGIVQNINFDDNSVPLTLPLVIIFKDDANQLKKLGLPPGMVVWGEINQIVGRNNLNVSEKIDAIFDLVTSRINYTIKYVSKHVPHDLLEAVLYELKKMGFRSDCVDLHRNSKRDFVDKVLSHSIFMSLVEDDPVQERYMAEAMVGGIVDYMIMLNRYGAISLSSIFEKPQLIKAIAKRYGSDAAKYFGIHADFKWKSLIFYSIENEKIKTFKALCESFSLQDLMSYRDQEDNSFLDLLNNHKFSDEAKREEFLKVFFRATGSLEDLIENKFSQLNYEVRGKFLKGYILLLNFDQNLDSKYEDRNLIVTMQNLFNKGIYLFDGFKSNIDDLGLGFHDFFATADKEGNTKSYYAALNGNSTFFKLFTGHHIDYKRLIDVGNNRNIFEIAFDPKHYKPGFISDITPWLFPFNINTDPCILDFVEINDDVFDILFKEGKINPSNFDISKIIAKYHSEFGKYFFKRINDPEYSTKEFIDEVTQDILYRVELQGITNEKGMNILEGILMRTPDKTRLIFRSYEFYSINAKEDKVVRVVDRLIDELRVIEDSTKDNAEFTANPRVCDIMGIIDVIYEVSGKDAKYFTSEEKVKIKEILDKHNETLNVIRRKIAAGEKEIFNNDPAFDKFLQEKDSKNRLHIKEHIDPSKFGEYFFRKISNFEDSAEKFRFIDDVIVAFGPDFKDIENIRGDKGITILEYLLIITPDRTRSILEGCNHSSLFSRNPKDVTVIDYLIDELRVLEDKINDLGEYSSNAGFTANPRVKDIMEIITMLSEAEKALGITDRLGRYDDELYFVRQQMTPDKKSPDSQVKEGVVRGLKEKNVGENRA